jgi:hypothetical protein
VANKVMKKRPRIKEQPAAVKRVRPVAVSSPKAR